jgi:hypothetical protein
MSRLNVSSEIDPARASRLGIRSVSDRIFVAHVIAEDGAVAFGAFVRALFSHGVGCPARTRRVSASQFDSESSGACSSA